MTPKKTAGKPVTSAYGEGPEVMVVEKVPIEELVLDPRNARRGSIPDLTASLRELGQHKAVVVRRANNQVVIGNHTVQAAQLLGWTQINVTYVDDDEHQAIRRAIADNAVGDQAEWDDAQLLSLLKEVGTDIPGVDEDLMHKLLSDVGYDEAPDEKPVYPITARMAEEYEYAVVVARNSVDAAWLRTVFALRPEKSYKADSVGLSRVVTVERLHEEMPKLYEALSLSAEDRDKVPVPEGGE